MPIQLFEIATEHALNDAMLDLRIRVLRAPLGMAYTPEQLAAESGDRRLVALMNDQLVGCIMLRASGNTVMKFRQMAVAPEYQGQGIGHTLLHFAEAVARSGDYTQVVLHARETAIPFYEKAGYVAVGETFTEVTLPHRKMIKAL